GDRIDLIVQKGVKVASFAMAPKQDLIRRLKEGGVVEISSVGAKRHAEKVAACGVDAVVVQGGEGGGHTGAVPTSLLLPQVVDGRPHRVLRTEFVQQLVDSGPTRRLPRALRNALAFKKLSGTPWSEIVREGVAMRRTQELSWSQVVMAANTPMLLKAAMVDG